MKLSTKTKELDIQQIRDIVNMTVSWCRQNMGENNRRKNRFKVSVRKQRPSKELFMGLFCQVENRLVVHYNNCDSVRLLICTTIHEYTHYLQPIASYYHKIYDRVGYEKHPMEIEAVENEKKYKQCWKSIKNYYNN